MLKRRGSAHSKATDKSHLDAAGERHERASDAERLEHAPLLSPAMQRELLRRCRRSSWLRTCPRYMTCAHVTARPCQSLGECSSRFARTERERREDLGLHLQRD